MFFLFFCFLGDPLHYERPEPSAEIDLWGFFKEFAGFVGFVILLGFFVHNALLTLSLLAFALTIWMAWIFFLKG